MLKIKLLSRIFVLFFILSNLSQTLAMDWALQKLKRDKKVQATIGILTAVGAGYCAYQLLKNRQKPKINFSNLKLDLSPKSDLHLGDRALHQSPRGDSHPKSIDPSDERSGEAKVKEEEQKESLEDNSFESQVLIPAILDLIAQKKTGPFGSKCTNLNCDSPLCYTKIQKKLSEKLGKEASEQDIIEYFKRLIEDQRELNDFAKNTTYKPVIMMMGPLLLQQKGMLIDESRREIINLRSLLRDMEFVHSLILPQPATDLRPESNGSIEDYIEDRDFPEVSSLYKSNWNYLGEAFDFDEKRLKELLHNKTPKNEWRDHYGKLNIKIIRDSGNIAGLISYYPYDLKKVGLCVSIHHLAIAEKYRNKGHAKKLMLYALEQIKKLGAKFATLSVTELSKEAVKLYRRIGFKYLFSTSPGGAFMIKEVQ